MSSRNNITNRTINIQAVDRSTGTMMGMIRIFRAPLVIILGVYSLEMRVSLSSWTQPIALR